MTATVIDGREIAKKIRKEIYDEVVSLKSKYNVTPKITTLLIGNDPGSKLYLKLRDNACNKVGITSDHLEFDENVSEDEIIAAIQNLNNDENVHGILIQYPVPSHISQDTLMSSIDPKKDVEGFHPYNMGRTLLGNESIVPCTPLSVLTILEHEQVDLKGKDVCIVNHSNVVGKPLAALLLNRNATVLVCHVFTQDTKQYTSKADVLITGAGVPKLITADHVKKDAFVIDVAIIPTKSGICGDVDFESVKEKAGKITPVPGGVGPVTIASALKNMIKTYKNCFEDA
ncbi:MAG: bifunctional 5,10-methylenetetrahydrofolate dehydrogenase/5,10-methenyltetrahydrofolate cyclohydrolase [Candidatus Thermoplasmatota archaeon]